MTGHIRVLMGAVGVACATGAASAFIPWTPYPAMGDSFTHFDGGSDLGAAGFGVPTVLADEFSFAPTQFTANAAAGSSASYNDRLEVFIDANTILDDIVVIETGTITGDVAGGNLSGGNDALFTVVGDVDIVANWNGFFPAAFSELLDVSVQVVDANTAKWTAIRTFDLSAGPDTFFQDVTEAILILENVITARSFGGTGTTVTKDSVQIFVPAPAGLAAMGMGLALAGRRRR
ncbi:MAG: hypothetical protein AAGK04_06455 [Planctomycetota bacterium]